jgi:Protein of unknown function (DUF3105)
VAKKKRTPPPPRRVQAPKQRHEPRQGLSPGRQRLLLYGLSGGGVVALIVVVIVVFAAGKGSGKAGNPNAVRSALAAAGCTLATSKAAPSAQHIPSLAASQHVTYSTYPPVSGRHYYIPAIWGNYTQAVDPRQAVHNLEHGGIDVWVGPAVSSAERAQINSFYDESPNAMLVTPIADQAPSVTYPKHSPPGSKVYLTAWTVQIQNGNVVKGTNVVATCPRFDVKAFRAFRDEFRGKGPERYPVSTLTPGT